MLKDFEQPTRSEESRKTADILRELANHLRYRETRASLTTLANELDLWATLIELQSPRVKEGASPKVDRAGTLGSAPFVLPPM
jgi:hypothetical protein